MQAAVIGIGSNSVRSLVARNNGGVFERLYRGREGTRLFAGLDSDGRLKEESIRDIEMEELSMGMSGDYRLAARRGATMVRVGSAIFGPRG